MLDALLFNPLFFFIIPSSYTLHCSCAILIVIYCVNIEYLLDQTFKINNDFNKRFVLFLFLIKDWAEPFRIKASIKQSGTQVLSILLLNHQQMAFHHIQIAIHRKARPAILFIYIFVGHSLNALRFILHFFLFCFIIWQVTLADRVFPLLSLCALSGIHSSSISSLPLASDRWPKAP